MPVSCLQPEVAASLFAWTQFFNWKSPGPRLIGGSARQRSFYGRAVLIGKQFESAAKLADAFMHPAKAHAHRAERLAIGFQDIARDALAGVLHFEKHGTVFDTYANAGGRAAGMAVDVGEAFLEHAEGNQLHVAWQAPEIAAEVERNVNAAAPGKAFDVPGYGSLQPHFLQHRRIQEI